MVFPGQSVLNLVPMFYDSYVTRTATLVVLQTKDGGTNLNERCGAVRLASHQKHPRIHKIVC